MTHSEATDTEMADTGPTPRLDVVILTWNDGPMLEVAVRSALDSENVTVRVIVVDNASEVPAVVPEDERVLLLRNQVNRGVARGRNQGIGAGDSEIVCLLDSDAELSTRSLRTLLEPLLKDSTVALAGPVYAGQPPEASAGRAPTFRRKLNRTLGRTSVYERAPGQDLKPWWDVDFVIGACQVMRRHAYDAVGGIDETFFYGPEDVDFCMRLRNAGWRVVQVADAGVDHPPRRRYRRVVTRRGVRHAIAVLRFLWRHRHYRSDLPST